MHIAVVGLGYVGLPLAIALAKKHDVIGFEVDKDRISELGRGHDSRGEIQDDEIAHSTIRFTCEAGEMKGAEVYFVTVPTPVDDAHLPDLSVVRQACRVVGTQMEKGAIVVLESSVYPGVTEEVCIPELELVSNLKEGEDFRVAHSPERVNPGDGLHSFRKVAKVVGATDLDLAEQVAEIYRGVIDAPVHVAPSLKVAEFSKILENTQRDINIALMNEAAMICQGLGISVYDVLDAASTKWNFARFEPGLVGGHCIGVDPYYLVEIGRRFGVDPELIRAARDRNEYMGVWLANRIYNEIEMRFGATPRGVNALVLGVTFKEDVPDIRNSKVFLMIKQLECRGIHVNAFDPVANFDEVLSTYGVPLLQSLDDGTKYDCIIGAVCHETFRTITAQSMSELLKPGAFVFDLKQIWPGGLPLPKAFTQLHL